MTILVKVNNSTSYTIDNVVSINKILDRVLIQYIDENNNPQNTMYCVDDTELSIMAIVC